MDRITASPPSIILLDTDHHTISFFYTPFHLVPRPLLSIPDFKIVCSLLGVVDGGFCLLRRAVRFGAVASAVGFQAIVSCVPPRVSLTLNDTAVVFFYFFSDLFRAPLQRYPHPGPAFPG